MMQTNETRQNSSAPLNVAFYLRVATDSPATKEEGSLDAQLECLNEFVQLRCQSGANWVVTEKLIEGEKDGNRPVASGANTNRPAYQKLLELARARLIDVVIVTELSRISRSVSDFLGLVAELEKHGVRLVSIRENIDLTSPAGWLSCTLLEALARCEREITSSCPLRWRGVPSKGSVMGHRNGTLRDLS